MSSTEHFVEFTADCFQSIFKSHHSQRASWRNKPAAPVHNHVAIIVRHTHKYESALEIPCIVNMGNTESETENTAVDQSKQEEAPAATEKGKNVKSADDANVNAKPAEKAQEEAKADDTTKGDDGTFRNFRKNAVTILFGTK